MKRLTACLLFLAMALACTCGTAEPLSAIYLPKGLKLIAESAFVGTSSFEKVVLPEGAERIESRAFASSGVREAYIPASVEYIAEDAFDGCENLKVIVPRNSYAHEWLALKDIEYDLLDAQDSAVYAVAGVSVETETDETGAQLVYAGASVTAPEACMLIVRVLSEDESALYTVSAPVEPAGQETYVRTALDAVLPAHYILEAVLADEAGAALCAPCRSLRHTQGYAEFEKRTIADYPEEKVLDFGTAGFAVMADGVIPLDVPAEQDGSRYTFAPDEAPQKGDIIRLDVSGVQAIIKVGSIRENGDGTVTVTADPDIYLEEMYDAVKISADMQGVPLQRAKSSGGSKLFNFKHTDTFGPIEIDAELSADIHVDFKYDKNILKDYELNITLDADGQLEVLLGAGIDTVKDELLTGEPAPAIQVYNAVVILPGVHAPAFLNVCIPLHVIAETGGSASIGFETCQQISFSGENGYSHKSENDTTGKAEIKCEFEIMTGVEVSLTVSLFGVVNARVGADIGPKLTGKEYGPYYGGSTKDESIHGCSDCMDLDLYAAADIRGTMVYRISKLLSGTLLDARIAVYENKLADAYFSVSNDEDSLYGGKPTFGMGDCKNFKYRVIAEAIDRHGTQAAGTPIVIENFGGSTQPEPGVSPYKLYLYNGQYGAEADFGGVIAQHFFEVKDAPIDVSLYEPALSVCGCVTDYTTGLPIGGAEVVVTMPSGEKAFLVTDENGCYALDMLPPGEYEFAFSADGYVSEDGVIRTLRADMENRVDAELVPEGTEGRERPYMLSQAWLSDENIEMGGKTYTDAVVFEMGYTGFASTRNKAEVAYNFKGKYSSLSFDVGYFDGKEKNAKLTVIADGATLYNEMEIAYDAAPQRITVPLSGVHQLIILFENSGSDKSGYAIGDIALFSSGGTSAKARVSDSGFDAYITEMYMAEVETGSFYMGGYNYLGGLIMTPGYNGTSNYDAYATFEFDGSCTGLSFDMTRIPGETAETYLREAKLTIEVNGTALTGYSEREVAWNDLPLEVNIPLSGASTVKVNLYSKGAGKLYWGMGNIRIQ